MAHSGEFHSKMGKINFFKSWISAFELIVAILTVGMVSINCMKQGLHLFHLFFGGGH
ncbi:hypothetical protein [Desulfurobacterium sp. TC5-1]|uniref:hypothetical protein n=1 Tax=Desulfurobacterium sp. TC5-1 TaxID=1158318 RepID=UPI0003B3EF56|nr:hypothetical protein [Desulfurobacterium sp. TC5-1]